MADQQLSLGVRGGLQRSLFDKQLRELHANFINDAGSLARN